MLSRTKSQFVMWFWLMLVFLCFVSAKGTFQNPNFRIVSKVLRQCFIRSKDKYSCLATKVAVALERAVYIDVPLFDGITLVRNREYVDNATSRGFTDDISRLSAAFGKFMESHLIKVDFSKTEGSARQDGGDGDGDGDGDGEKDKFLRYAMMFMLGATSISGPLILKTLGLLAGKALIASKLALLISAAMALKQLFSKDDSHATVKVHTHTLKDYPDDHDRRIDQVPYNYLKTYN